MAAAAAAAGFCGSGGQEQRLVLFVGGFNGCSPLTRPTCHQHNNTNTIINTNINTNAGLTKVAIEGQPASIVQDLEDMCKQYIKGDNAIILAVSPANADLATSDALRLAKEVDPLGERTIGVLTKIDIMDKGTDCRDVLCGRSLRLRHGWVGVVNRGQADINKRTSMAEARAREGEFFRVS